MRKRFVLEFSVDNDALLDEETGEVDLLSVSEIVARVAEDLSDGWDARGVWDANGNMIGSFGFGKYAIQEG